jgi:hypothetical protein
MLADPRSPPRAPGYARAMQPQPNDQLYHLAQPGSVASVVPAGGPSRRSGPRSHLRRHPTAWPMGLLDRGSTPLVGLVSSAKSIVVRVRGAVALAHDLPDYRPAVASTPLVEQDTMALAHLVGLGNGDLGKFSDESPGDSCCDGRGCLLVRVSRSFSAVAGLSCAPVLPP